MEETPTTIALTQPTRRREWELRRGDVKLGELRLPAMRRGGSAEVDGRELRIRAHGLLRPEHVVVDAATGEEVARVHGRRVEIGGEHAEWRALGRGGGYGLVGADGEPWLRARVSSGIARTTGQIEVAAGREAALPAVLAAYLLIRRAEAAAEAAAATVAAT